MTEHVRYDEMIDFLKMYVVVRGDLDPGRRAAQVAHAVVEMCLHHPQLAGSWHDDPHGNYLIVLEAEDEEHLLEWFGEVGSHSITRELFREPDFGYDATAFAALPMPEMNPVFGELPLAYSRRRWWPRFRR